MSGRQYADYIFQGGTVYCGKGLKENYDFVAVGGEKILDVGYKGQEKDWIGPHTNIIQLGKEQMVMPGLHDHHIHLIQAGMLDKYVNLGSARSQDEAARMTAEFAQTIPEEPWVIGFGWCRLSWDKKDLPTKESLDRYLPDRPVFLFDSELHGAWINSRALEICGITKETQAPRFGEIVKDERGEPSGYLCETALCLAGKYALNFNDSLAEDLISRYMTQAVKWGITSVTDMTPYLGLDLSYPQTYLRMDKENKLKIRINAARNLFEDMDTFLAIKQNAESAGTGMYRIPYMKQFLDGVIANYTAYLLNDYCDKPGEKGGTLLDPGKLQQAVDLAHENNIEVRLHACGEGAVHMALNAYESAERRLGKKPNVRHQIEHIESIIPEDIERFVQLNVVASVQPEHIVSGIPSFADNCYPRLLGKERDRYTWPFKTLLEKGAVLACGSDAPVVEGNPFRGIFCGMERIHPDGTPAGGWNPQEKLSAEQLLWGYTWGAAYGEGREHELGTLEKGKLADLIVIDQNLLTASASQIEETQVLYTMVNGKLVYQKG